MEKSRHSYSLIVINGGYEEVNTGCEVGSSRYHCQQLVNHGLIMASDSSCLNDGLGELCGQ